MDSNFKIVNVNEDINIALHVPTMNVTIIKNNFTDLNSIEEKLKNEPDVEKVLLESRKSNPNRLSGLILNTTETCNLACDYCMVSKGTYKNENSKKHMALEDYVKTFNFMFEHFKEGTTFVCFFGGEPLLRLDTIMEAVDILNSMFEERNLTPPRYSIISNGVLINDRLINFLNEKNIYLSISIDGIEELHDSARVFPNGKGSFSTIKRNLLYLKEKGRNFPLIAEATIHKKHLDLLKGNEVEGGYNFVKNLYNLGFDTVYVFPVDSKDKDISIDSYEYYERLKLFFKGVYDYYMELFLSEKMKQLPPGHFVGVFGNIFMKRANRFCKAGLGTLFVNPEGELYPCHLLYNTRYMRLGSLDTGFEDSEEVVNFRKYINNRYDIKKCRICKNRNLCFLWCAGSSVLSNGKILSTVNSRCMVVDITVNYVLKEIAELLINKDKSRLFMNNLKKAAQEYKSVS